MVYLTYNNQLRTETDINIINNLIRKGWAETSKPSESSYWQNGEWVEPSQQELDAQQRATERSALRQQWDALPAYIRGPYRDKFEAANRLLDEGDDESAIALIEYTEPMPGFTDDQTNIFNIAKQQMQQGIANLPNIS